MTRYLAIETAGLAKHFGDKRAVDGLDLVVPAGQVYGVLGPNGAGKTTAIRMLATLLKPTAGTAHVFGHGLIAEPERVRSWVSLTGQFASVDDELTGVENLVLLARLGVRARARSAPCGHPSRRLRPAGRRWSTGEDLFRRWERRCY